ncbi:hypothetical protein CY34DRAFT_650947 [Suillus luteus UH-Slu-Lm8-n1]|uniref:Uncharacterized protein n=1 Tax=Suillus luteus UH-Slu-Lm8-n1 TaxID=930992 RepID=A0A0D0A2H2_9AGAM|nr:hypothetical protein CY34DRAFT_650947 [Suillus luteus UH-Slu-Lm8-n1]
MLHDFSFGIHLMGARWFQLLPSTPVQLYHSLRILMYLACTQTDSDKYERKPRQSGFFVQCRREVVKVFSMWVFPASSSCLRHSFSSGCPHCNLSAHSRHACALTPWHHGPTQHFYVSPLAQCDFAIVVSVFLR